MTQTTINFDVKPEPPLNTILENIKSKTDSAKNIIEMFRDIKSTEEEKLPRGLEIRMTALQAVDKFENAAAAYSRGIKQIGVEFEEEGDKFLRVVSDYGFCVPG